MARNFNGTSALIRADGAQVFQSSAACSFSLWVRGFSGTSNVIYGEANTGSNNNNIRIQTDPTTGVAVEFVVHTTLNTLALVGSATAFAAGVWHHVLVTQTTGRVATIYVDGVQDAQGTAGTSTFSTTNTAIGALFRSTAAFFYGGDIAEVANWPRTLSAEEAVALASGLPASYLGPSHYWPLWGADSPEPDIGNG